MCDVCRLFGNEMVGPQPLIQREGGKREKGRRGGGRQMHTLISNKYLAGAYSTLYADDPISSPRMFF